MADSHNVNHDYHILPPSPWPFIGSFGALTMAIGAIAYMRYLDLTNQTDGQPHIPGELWMFGVDLAQMHSTMMLVGLAIVLYTMFAWWSDTVKESHQGHHTRVVSIHLRYGMLLFIASEVMFFVAWFWAFFDASLFAGEAAQYARFEFTGGHWPPDGIEVLDPWHLPLYNTIILLLSGTTVTWAHHALLEDDRKTLVWMLAITVALGILFSFVQGYEYAHAPFTFAGSIYGSTFFMATGFHGFHVIVGTIFLLICLFRAMAGDFTPKQHFGFEAAAWYWHFVDVVWLFLFCSIYVWGSAGATIAH